MMRMYTQRSARMRDRAREAAKLFRAEAPAIDAEDTLPASLLEKLWEAGFMNGRTPRELGGEDLSLPELSIVVEELARGSGAAGLAVLLQALGVSVLRELPKSKTAADWLRRIGEGRLSLAFALSEPAPAPGEKARVTRARKLKSEYLLSGKKTFVSGARDADLTLVFAVTAPKVGLKRALSAFLVPAGTTGLLPGRELPKAGLRGVPAVELWLTNCRVGTRARLGQPGQGYEIARRAIIAALPLAAALAGGLLREALEYTLFQVKAREYAGIPLSEFQPLELALAEISAGLDSALGLTWAAAGAVEDNLPEGARLAREAKWVATETAVRGIDQLASMFGVEGSLRGSPLERLSRDARACQVLLGANHVHRIEVARKLIWGERQGEKIVGSRQ